jgi:hypothetical protein
MDIKLVRALFISLILATTAAIYVGINHGFWAGFWTYCGSGSLIFVLLMFINSYFPSNEQSEGRIESEND